MTQDLKTRIDNIYALDREFNQAYIELIEHQQGIIRSLEAKVAQLEEKLNEK